MREEAPGGLVPLGNEVNHGTFLVFVRRKMDHERFLGALWRVRGERWVIDICCCDTFVGVPCLEWEKTVYLWDHFAARPSV